MRTSASLLLVVPALLLATVIATAQPAQRGGATPPPPLKLTSTAFADSAPLPVQYTCSAKGTAVNPPLQWTDVPPGTASFALIVHDLEPRNRKGVEDSLHWMRWNIPAGATSIPEGVSPAEADLPDGSRQSQPGNPTPGFRRPCPPANVSLPHHYTFELFALDQKLDLPPGTSRNDLLKAMDGHIVGHAVLIGLFHR